MKTVTLFTFRLDAQAEKKLRRLSAAANRTRGAVLRELVKQASEPRIQAPRYFCDAPNTKGIEQ